MITDEVLSALSANLSHDDGLLSAGEKELIARLMRHAKIRGGDIEARVAGIVSLAVGEIFAERMYKILGTSVLDQLDKPTSRDSDRKPDVVLQSAPRGPAPPRPPLGPQPPGSPMPRPSPMPGPPFGHPASEAKQLSQSE